MRNILEADFWFYIRMLLMGMANVESRDRQTHSSGENYGIIRGEDGGETYVKAICVFDEPPKGLIIKIR